MSPRAIRKQSPTAFMTASRSHQDHPLLGRARPEIQPEARSIVIERWLALYRVTQDGAQIVRVIDAARDLSAIEWSPE
jgi:toxin ParE1/3/4